MGRVEWSMMIISMYLYDDDYWGNNQNLVLRSVDMGLSFSPSDTIASNNNARGYLSVSADCPDCLYFASTNGIWKSVDQGLTFTFLNNPPQSCLGFAVNDLDTSAMIYGFLPNKFFINRVFELSIN